MNLFRLTHPGKTLSFEEAQPDEGVNFKERGDFYYSQFKNPKQPQNQLDYAINEYIKAAELSDDPELLAQIARTYLLNGQYDQAKRSLEKLNPSRVLEKNTQRKVLELTGYLYARYGELDKANTVLSKALHYEKPWRTAKLHWAMAGIRMEQLQTQASLMKWLSWGYHMGVGLFLSPFSEAFGEMMSGAQMKLQSTLAKVGTLEQQVDAHLKFFQQFPGADTGAVDLGKLYMAMDQYREAEFWFSRAIARHPSRDEGYRSMVNLYRTTNDITQLTEVLQNWLKIRPNSGEIMLVLSQALSQNPDSLEDAIGYAKQALVFLKNPAMIADTYAHLGMLYTSFQSYEAAIIAYEAALSIKPDYLEVYLHLGTLYYDKKEYLLSQRVFEKALSLSVDNARILCNLGYLAWMQGEISQALNYYHQCIELDPTYDIALNNLGVLYLDHVGDVHQAMALFDQTLQHNPYYALCHYNRGRAFSFLGQPVEAARCFTQAQELNDCSQELDDRELTDRIKQLFDHSASSHQTDL